MSSGYSQSEPYTLSTLYRDLGIDSAILLNYERVTSGRSRAYEIISSPASQDEDAGSKQVDHVPAGICGTFAASLASDLTALVTGSRLTAIAEKLAVRTIVVVIGPPSLVLPESDDYRIARDADALLRLIQKAPDSVAWVLGPVPHLDSLLRALPLEVAEQCDIIRYCSGVPPPTKPVSTNEEEPLFRTRHPPLASGAAARRLVKQPSLMRDMTPAAPNTALLVDGVFLAGSRAHAVLKILRAATGLVKAKKLPLVYVLSEYLAVRGAVASCPGRERGCARCCTAAALLTVLSLAVQGVVKMPLTLPAAVRRELALGGVYDSQSLAQWQQSSIFMI